MKQASTSHVHHAFWKKKKKRTKAWFTQSWCLLIKSTIGNCCSCCRCRGGQYNNNNNNCYWSFILSIKLPFLKKKTGERWTFSFQNYKMAATSCYIHIYFFAILACARVLLGDSRLPLNKCDQLGRFTLGQWCTVSHRGNPGWSWFFTVVYSFLDSLLRVSQSLLNSFLYLGKLQWFPSLRQSYFYKPSVITLRYVGDRISWKTWCWNKNDGPGAEMSSRASSYLVYYILWRVNLGKLSRNKDNNN